MREALLAAPPMAMTLEDVAAQTGGALLGDSGTSLLGVSIDSRTVGEGELFFAIVGPHFDGHDFLEAARTRGARAAVVSKEVSAPPGLGLVRVLDTSEALLSLARHVRGKASQPFVCITGSAGKTTTKNMTAALLERRGKVLKTEGNLNNRYGLPLTIFRLREEHQSAVLELGMSAPGELRELTGVARPDVAVITNVGPAHLGFFPSVEAIADAKAEILEGLSAGGVAVLNADNPWTRRIGLGAKSPVVYFGRGQGASVSAENWKGSVHGSTFDLRLPGGTVEVRLPLAGEHQVMNFLAAAAVADHFSIPKEEIAETARTLLPAPHRGEILRLGSAVTVIDDTYNASPDALEAALKTLESAPGRRRVALLGDMLELGEEGPLLHRMAGESLVGRADVVAGIGELSRHLIEGALSAGLQRGVLHHFDKERAEDASVLVEAGDTVLVKGSRGMRLERIVAALVARFGGTPSAAKDGH